MHAIIFAGGTLRPGKAVTDAIQSADVIIAADKGAATARRYGCTPGIVVGDFDSLDPEETRALKQRGVRLMQVAIEKDETDTELAIQTAIDEGASTITLLGGFGGERIDHAIANIFLLAGFTTQIYIIDGPTTSWLLRGPGRSTITGQAGDLLSLFPLAGDARGISTEHLYYPLHNDTLTFGKPRGISNMLMQPQAEITLAQGLLLVMHTSKQELKE